MNRNMLAAGTLALVATIAVAQIRPVQKDQNSLQEQINALTIRVNDQAAQIKAQAAQIEAVDFNLRHHGHMGLMPFPPFGPTPENMIKQYTDAAVRSRPLQITPSYMAPLWTGP